MRASKYFLAAFSITFASGCLMLLTLGCTPGYWEDRLAVGTGGGQDAIAMHLPFEEGYVAKCTQGPGGEYSHSYASTLYDVDFDTPNDADDLVFAPVSGIAYVHDTDTETGFGVHVNIDLSDGTFVTVGHLKQVFVENGVEVAAGQLVGYEGTTGQSTGDHVHLGRHRGDPAQDGVLSTSVEGLSLQMSDQTAGVTGTFLVDDLICSLTGGHNYVSQLPTPKWHPNGSVIKTPSDTTIYLVEDGALRAFANEDAFWDAGRSFDEVLLVSESELACYATAEQVAKSSLPTEVYPDGMLLTERSTSDVYVVSDGMAMPIADWETFLLMGYRQDSIVVVDDGRVSEIFDRVGDCLVNAYCIDRDDALTCGGPTGEEGVYDKSTDSAEPQTDTGSEGMTNATDLVVYWEAPDGAHQDRITLSGEYVDATGASTGWRTWEEVTGESIVAEVFTHAQSGDTFRFSVEFETDGRTSWSCLAPFPPGTTQGTVWADYGDSFPSVTAVADPTSDGCGLLVTVP